MDAQTKALVLNKALDRLVLGEDTIKVLSDVFSAGYSYGLTQGHWDHDRRNVG